MSDYSNFQKVENSYVVNSDDKAYNIAIKRIEKEKQFDQLSTRVSTMEEKLDSIITLLSKGLK